MRVNRYLAACGLGSRRACETMIANGEVEVNGRRIDRLGVQIDPRADRVRVGGNEVRPETIMMYVALNKPAGYVTTARDEKGRNTILDLVKMPVRVYPVGRLDRDSEGLLLLTNDGELAFKLTHPRYKVARVYRVLLNARLREEHARQFRQGVRISASELVSGKLLFPYPGQRDICEVTIHAGRNRQVRRMFAALGYRAKGLQRVSIGPLQLGRLKIGAWRYLMPREVRQLQDAVKEPDGNSR
jgi:23S rRNA pseudouridine2605 synthase